MQTKRLFFIIVLYWFSLYLHIPYQSVYLTGLMVTGGLLGIIVGAYGYAQVAFRMPLSIFVDKSGKQKTLMMVGSIAPAFAGMIRLLQDNPQGYFIANIVGGFGASFWVLFIVDFSKRVALSDENRDGSALVNFANQSGIFLAYVFGMLTYKYGGMKILLIASIVTSVISFILLISMKEIVIERKPSSDDINLDQPSMLKIILTDKSLLKALPVGFFHFGLLSATIQSLSIQRIAQLKATDFQIGLLNVIYISSTVLMSLLLARISHKGTDLECGKSLAISFLLNGIYHFSFMHLNNFILIGFVQVIAGVFSAISASCGIKMALATVPDEVKNVAMGLYQTFVALGMSIVPSVLGILVDRTNIIITYNLVGAVCVLLIVYSFAMKEKDFSTNEIGNC